MTNLKLLSRRQILTSGALAAAATTTLPAISLPVMASAATPLNGALKSIDPWHNLKVGVASYTLR